MSIWLILGVGLAYVVALALVLILHYRKTLQRRKSKKDIRLKTNVLLVYKQIGETPVDVVNRVSKKLAIDGREPELAFAGRLDPMACGWMHILLNDEKKNAEHYNHLDKTYQFQILVNFCNTDTTDILGIVDPASLRTVDNSLDNGSKINPEDIINAFCRRVGKQNQRYHQFSSFVISTRNPTSGKKERHPLWYYTINNRLAELVPFPSKDIEIYSCINRKFSYHNTINVLNDIQSRINRCGHPELRLDSIQKQWQDMAASPSALDPRATILKMKFEAKVSYGTYIRQLISDVSAELSIPMTVLQIKRLAYQ
jgi:tRNA U55 pseudouridine synthase TruB